MGRILIHTLLGSSDRLDIQTTGIAPASRQLLKEGPTWRWVRDKAGNITSFEDGVRQALQDMQTEAHDLFIAIESYPGYILCSDNLGWPKARIMRIGSKWVARIYGSDVPSRMFDSIPCYEPDWVPLVALEWVREQLVAAKAA